MSTLKELIKSAYGKKLPSVTGTLSGTYSSSESQSATDSTTPETFTDKYKLTVSQNLYDGGFNNLEIDRSKILYDNEILYFKNTIQNLVLSAIEGYLLVINYKNSAILYIYLSLLLIGTNIYYANLLN